MGGPSSRDHARVKRLQGATMNTPTATVVRPAIRPLSASALIVAMGGLLGGCGMLSPKVEVATVPSTLAQPVQPVPLPPAQTNGAIFQSVRYRPLFEDHRARLVGDTLTVQIVEKVSASQSSSSTVDKSGSVSGAVTAFPGLAANSFTAPRASVGGSSANTFAGKGSTESSNEFTGVITATVIGVLANGNLLVAGEKQIGVNENVDVLRFSGEVDPRNIRAGNSVQSAQIANVRLEHKGRGQQAEAQGIGWLARFFLNVLPI